MPQCTGGGEEDWVSLGFSSPLGALSQSPASWWPEKIGLVLHLWFFYLPPHPTIPAQTASKWQDYGEQHGSALPEKPGRPCP